MLKAAISNLAVFALSVLILHVATDAQSTDQNYPTPVTSPEIHGTIKARDIGDARLTSYFYAFDGGQGDIFINVVSKNFSGDIDIFNADGLRPLTKMVIYADSAPHETGRLIYLRKGERLLLRIEGRSPNDDPADFRIKFGGSFIALAPQKTEDAPTIARTDTSAESGVRVNSVGTIIPSPAKPPPVRTPIENVEERVAAKPEVETPTDPPPVETPPVRKAESDAGFETVFGNKAAKVTVEKAPKPAEKTSSRARKTAASKSAVKMPKPPAEPKVELPDPLASIRLIVQLKDGETIERPMNEVVRFSVDKGVLTVILKDGKTTRYSILDVAKVTIE